jgi:Domain of unknown function (DUF6378)
MSDDEIKTIMADRGKSYGAYADNAHLTQRFKKLLRDAPSFHQMPDWLREAFEMTLHKIARAANGNPLHRDNIVDAIGYLQLALNELDAENEQFDKAFRKETPPVYTAS